MWQKYSLGSSADDSSGSSSALCAPPGEPAPRKALPPSQPTGTMPGAALAMLNWDVCGAYQQGESLSVGFGLIP